MAVSTPKAIEERTATASYVLTLRHIVWIEEEAKRLSLNRSELIRTLLDRAIADQSKQTAQVA